MSMSLQYKCIVLGDAGAGKTSILFRYMQGTYMKQPYTVGVDFHCKNVEYLNRKIQLHCWDTAGQERYRSLIPSYLQRTVVFLMVYDCTKRSTFENLSKIWLPLIQNTNDDHACLVYLIGAKEDLSYESTVSPSDQRKFEKNVKNFLGNRVQQVRSYSCSALSGKGVNEIFDKVVEDIVVSIENKMPKIYTKMDLQTRVLKKEEKSGRSCCK